MAESSFYAANLGRNYPLIATPPGLQDTLLADFGCVVGQGSGYRVGVDGVWLQSVTKQSAGALRFRFQCSAPGLLGVNLDFNRLVDDDRLSVEFAGDNTAFSGYLVTGEIPVELWSQPDDAGLTFVRGQSAVEPTLVQNSDRSQLTRLGVVNRDRVRAASPTGCSSPAWSHTLQRHYGIHAGLTGVIRFAEGHNSLVRSPLSDNSIGFGAGVGLGIGEPCGELPAFVGEVPPTGSPFLSGGPSCKDVLLMVNGLSRRNVQIFGGAGIEVEASPDTHTVKLTVRRTAARGCQ